MSDPTRPDPGATYGRPTHVVLAGIGTICTYAGESPGQLVLDIEDERGVRLELVVASSKDLMALATSAAEAAFAGGTSLAHSAPRESVR